MENDARERYNKFFIRGDFSGSDSAVQGPVAEQDATRRIQSKVWNKAFDEFKQERTVYDAGYRKWLDEGGVKD